MPRSVQLQILNVSSGAVQDVYHVIIVAGSAKGCIGRRTKQDVRTRDKHISVCKPPFQSNQPSMTSHLS